VGAEPAGRLQDQLNGVGVPPSAVRLRWWGGIRALLAVRP
jgi:hypothetical protein